MRFISVVFVRLVIVAIVTALGSSRSATAQTLAIQGDHFAVNGQGRFLIFVSYFDALRRANAGDLTTDFGFLGTTNPAVPGRVDGIRILPNWYSGSAKAADTLFDPNGNIRDVGWPGPGISPWARFVAVLQAAKTYNLLVDVTFTIETIACPPPSACPTLETYKTGIKNVEVKLRSTYPDLYQRVFFDVQNEFNNNLFHGELLDVQYGHAHDLMTEVQTAPNANPGAILTASATNEGIPPEPFDAGQKAVTSQFPIVAFHEKRTSPICPAGTPPGVVCHWYEDGVIRDVLTNIRSGLGGVIKPIALDEPQKWFDDPTLGHFTTAVKAAKKYGAALWTFHTQTTFGLASQTMVSLMTPNESNEISGLRSSANGVAWGVTSPLRFPSADFDGDVKSDVGVFRPSNVQWLVIKSSTTPPTGVVFATFGASSDIPVPRDYDGDGKTDVAVFTPGTALWSIWQSGTQSGITYTWGNGSDILVPADYDGDGKADIAVFRPGTGVWYIWQSATQTGSTRTWGGGGDIPVPADYDGDGKADVAVFRPSDGTWYIIQSSTQTNVTHAWGGGGDIPVVGDYDGDFIADIAVYRPSTGVWYISQSKTQTNVTYTFGNSGSIPTPADYDGDDRVDVAVFDPTTAIWSIWQSKTSTGVSYTWGSAGDVPLTKRP